MLYLLEPLKVIGLIPNVQDYGTWEHPWLGCPPRTAGPLVALCC